VKVSLLFFLFCLVSLQAFERPLYEQNFKTEATGIFLPIEIEGEQCSFLFDTGASFVVLDKRFKHLMGEPLSVQEAEARTGLRFANKPIQTPNGEISLEMYKALPLRIGRLQVANRFPYLLADLQALWPFAGEKFCGILGTSFLHQFRWEIDFSKGKIKAYIGAEPYMQAYTSRTPIFYSKSRIPQVAIGFEGQEIAFDIDTGDNGAGRMKRENLLFLQRQGQVLAFQEQDVVTVSALSTSKEYRLRSLRFANVAYPEVVMQESGQNAIGLGLLKRHNVVFDFPFNMLYLQHHKDYAQKQRLDKSGLRVILKEGKLVVFSKKEHAGAVLKNIEVGDVIQSVKGLKGLSLYKMRALLRQKEGRELFLNIIREDKEQEAYIKLGKETI